MSDEGRQISASDDHDLSYLFTVRPQPDWADGGAVCLTVGPEPWLSESLAEQREAAKICATCPMQKACLEWSLDPTNDVTWGTWGGLNHIQRAAGVTDPDEDFTPVHGVTWNDVRRRWIAQLGGNQSDTGRYVGTFTTYGEAKEALEKASARLEEREKGEAA